MYRVSEHIARSLFVMAWADWAEQHGPGYPMGCELFDVAPKETDPSAYYTAGRIESMLETINNRSFPDLIQAARPTWKNKSGLPFEEELGHYIAMEVVGSGVSWEDRNDPLPFKVPDFEYTYYDLDDAKYPISPE